MRETMEKPFIPPFMFFLIQDRGSSEAPTLGTKRGYWKRKTVDLTGERGKHWIFD